MLASPRQGRILFAREESESNFSFLALFTDEKRGKSQQGGLAPSSFRTTGGVHELVARAVRGKCVRHGARMKTAVSHSP